jgi:hypothetical protein
VGPGRVSVCLRENRPLHYLQVFPLGHPYWASPLAEGRAPHARNLGITLTQMLSPFGYRLIVKPPMATQCVGIRTAVPCGRGDRAPPRKPPSALSPGFSARPSVLGSPLRRGGLRTPVGETSLLPGDRPIRPPGVPLPPMIMLCLGSRTASQCGRGDRVPCMYNTLAVG